MYGVVYVCAAIHKANLRGCSNGSDDSNCLLSDIDKTQLQLSQSSETNNVLIIGLEKAPVKQIVPSNCHLYKEKPATVKLKVRSNIISLLKKRYDFRLHN